MYKYLFIIACVGSFACNSVSENTTYVSSWHYAIQNHNDNLDRNCQPLIYQYQQLQKGVMSKDTSFINGVVHYTIQLTDSLANLKLPLDSNLQKKWVDGLGNINAEYQGLLTSNLFENPQEFYMSLNMCSIQIVNLLGEIGFKEQSIYIFNSKSEKLDDGYFWFGLQKTSRDPYKPEKRDLNNADQILQEPK